MSSLVEGLAIGLPLFGGIAGLVGFFAEVSWLFWIGASFSAANLFMNLASETIRFPFLTIVYVVVAFQFVEPWYVAVALGLVMDAAIEFAGIVLRMFRNMFRKNEDADA